MPRTAAVTVQLFCSAVFTLPVTAQQPGRFHDIVGDWHGHAAIAVDEGLPVSVLLKLIDDAGKLRALLTLPESRQTDLELPSPVQRQRIRLLGR